MRTKRTSITFRNDFILAGFDAALPAGTYEISTEDEETDTMLSQGWRRVSTMLRTPSLEHGGGLEQWTNVHPTDLESALMRDTGSAMSNPRAIADLEQFIKENRSTIEEMENGRITYEENGVDKTQHHVFRLRYENSQYQAQVEKLHKDDED